MSDFHRSWFRSGFGIVAFFSLLAAGAFLLQLFPGTGVFLMILGGGVIIGALVHIMMIFLVFAAVGGSIGRAWLLLPLAYYAGGFALHLESVKRAKEAAAAIEKANASQSFLAKKPFTYLTLGGTETLELLKRFKIDAAYSKQYVHSKEREIEYAAYFYAKGDNCDKGSFGYYFDKRFSQPSQWDRDLFPSYEGKDKTRQSIQLQSFETADPRYSVQIEFERDKAATRLYRQFIYKWMARDITADQIVASVEVGTMTPLPPIQFIVAGCALNSGAPSWDCGASLMYGSEEIVVGYKKRTDTGNPFTPVVDVDTSPAAALGHALGLEPRTPTD